MDSKLFKSLHSIVNVPSLYFEIPDDKFFHFLIGFYSNDGNYPYDLINSCIYEKKTLCSVFNNHYSNILILNNSMHLDDLIEKMTTDPRKALMIKNAIISKKDEITQLFSSYFYNPSMLETDQMLKALFRTCIYEIKTPFFAKKYRPLKPSTINTTVGRDDDYDKLVNVIKNHHKIVISGEHGSGKSRFIQYYLSKIEKKDFCYINYCNDLPMTLAKLEFYDESKKSIYYSNDFSLKTDCLAYSLLVIDNVCFSSHLIKELRWLSELYMDVIVITTSPINLEGFINFQMSDLSDKSLVSIYENITKSTLSDKNLKSQLLELSGRNALLVSLIACQCEKSFRDKSNSADFSTILNNILCRLFILNNHMSENTVNTSRFKHPYTKKTLDLIGHVKSIYVLFKGATPKILHTYMMFLCCFGWSPLPIKFLESILPSYNSANIDKLSQFGLVSVTEEYVQLSPIVCHSIFAVENPTSLDLYELVTNLSTYLREYDRTLSVPFLSDSLYIFAQTVYSNVDFKNNENQKRTSKYFNSWQELMYLINNYYHQNNDSESADRILSFIYYPENIKQPNSFLDRLFLSLSNKMLLESEFKNIPAYIESLYSLCKYFRVEQIFITAASYFLINVMDNVIILYLSQFLSSSTDLLILYPNSFSLLCVMDKILSYLISLEKNGTSPVPDGSSSVPETTSLNFKMPIPSSKLELYKSLRKLKLVEEVSSENIKNLISEIESYKNIDCRIRKLTFHIIIETCMLSYFDSNAVTSRIDNIINPLIQMLNNAIKDCKLIPIQTFRLCMYAYISSITILKAYKDSVPFNYRSSLDPFLIKKEHLINLTERCHLTNDFLNNEEALLDSFSDIIGDLD